MMAVIVVVKELALDHVQITARIHALGIAKVDVLQVVQIAMAALIVVAAMVAAVLGASCPCSPCPCGCVLRCALYSLCLACLIFLG